MQNKRIISVFIMLIFCAALAIGGSTVFTVAEVEASYSLISNEQKAKINDVDTLLDSFEGENIMLLKNSEITELLKSYTYLKITEIKKVYPNSIIVKISERKELFAVLSGQKYFMLDREGFVLSEKNLNQNNIDNQANIILQAEGQYNVGTMAVPDNSEMFNCLLNIAVLTDTFFYNINSNDNIRNNIAKISIVNGININLLTAEGLNISINDALINPIEKIAVVLTKYLIMTPEQKAAFNAKLIVYCNTNNEIVTVYSTNSK